MKVWGPVVIDQVVVRFRDAWGVLDKPWIWRPRGRGEPLDVWKKPRQLNGEQGRRSLSQATQWGFMLWAYWFGGGRWLRQSEVANETSMDMRGRQPARQIAGMVKFVMLGLWMVGQFEDWNGQCWWVSGECANGEESKQREMWALKMS